MGGLWFVLIKFPARAGMKKLNNRGPLNLLNERVLAFSTDYSLFCEELIGSFLPLIHRPSWTRLLYPSVWVPDGGNYTSSHHQILGHSFLTFVFLLFGRCISYFFVLVIP